jgi:hypothetical protein
MTDKLYNLDIWVYSRIKFFSDKDMECFESNDSMAKLFGRHKNRVSASIQKLTRLGHIKNLGTNKYNRRLITTEKVIDICGVTINKNGVTINNNSAKLTPTLSKGININGVRECTKTVLALDKNGDIYKYLYKYFINEYLKKEEKRNIKEKNNFGFIENSDWKNLFSEWIEYKKTQFRFVYASESSLQTAYNQLVSYSGDNLQTAKEIVGNSIANGYKGLFKPKEVNGNSRQPKKDTIESNDDEIRKFLNKQED